MVNKTLHYNVFKEFNPRDLFHIQAFAETEYWIDIVFLSLSTMWNTSAVTNNL